MESQGQRTLEAKPENLDMSAQVDSELMVDPLFKQMTAKFDELSLGNLMTSKLTISSDLLVQLDSTMP